MAKPKTMVEPEIRQLDDIKKGDRVRLLVPIFDGVQRIETGAEILWPYDEPPLVTVAAKVSDRRTPLDAPAMTDGKPPEGYRDPVTGEPPVIPSA